MSVSLQSLMRDGALDAPRSLVLAQFVAFVAIGGAAALAFVVLSSVMIGLGTGVADWLMSALCYAVFIVPVYLLHRRLSFASTAPHGRALPRYVLVQLMALLLAALFSLIVYGALRLPTPLAALTVIALTSGINFVVLRLWAFATA